MAWRDPITGDEMSTGDRVWWVAMTVIRGSWFLPLFAVLTAIDWSQGFDRDHLWWNLSASFLAIVVEAIVGRAMYAQTKRDAMILREIKKLVEKAEEQIEEIEEELSGE